MSLRDRCSPPGPRVDAALDLGLGVGIDEQVQGMIVLQDHVGAAAHDDAVPLLGEVFNDLLLGGGYLEAWSMICTGGMAKRWPMVVG